MDTNLSLYHVFHSVATHQNISKASKELYISQPAVSKSIQKLEETMDAKLFTRNSRGVALTEEGKILYHFTSSAFGELEKGIQNIKKLQSLNLGHIRIGASTTLCKYMLLPYLKYFINRFPHIKISISCQSTYETVTLIENGKLDIGLTGKFDSSKQLYFHKITEIQDTFVATQSYIDNQHQLDFGQGIVTENPMLQNKSQKLLSRCNLMLLDEHNISRLYVNQYLSNHGIEANQILEISNMDLLIEFAKIGLGVACVIKDFVVDDIKRGTLTEVLFDDPIPKRGVGFAYSKHSLTNPAVDTFLRCYEDYEG